ncbi:MAG: VWA domain-containing protein [Acidihalobacter sp.]|uniref:nitric oxide reductase activation protein NorD n=1 Tax=Acidihalobacter sp. TaxID=1872108 RepID=UPI00307E908B
MNRVREREVRSEAVVFFGEMRRRLQLYLTALWGRSFALDALAPDDMGQVRIRGEVVLFPAALSAEDVSAAQACYRAAAAHAAAHLMYSQPLSREALKPRQMALIELIEDARVEHLAFRRFPGLRRLWLPLHPPAAAGGDFDALAGRLARALMQPEDAKDSNEWVAKGVRLFLEHRHELDEPAVSRKIGLKLAHDLGQMRIPMNEGMRPCAPYRDDNAHLWLSPQAELAEDEPAAPATSGLHETDRLEEAGRGRSVAFTESADDLGGSDAGYRVEDCGQSARLSYFQMRHDRQAVCTAHYPEWHERIGVARQDWCTVVERYAERGTPCVLPPDKQALLASLRRIVAGVKVQRVARLRRQEDGDDFDWDAVLTAVTDLHIGREPDFRVFQRMRHHDVSRLAVSLLLDLSASANAIDDATGRRILDVAREACQLLAQTAVELGDPLSVNGFRSNGRQQVEFLRVKGFADAYDDAAKERLGGLAAAYSTRTGAAIRHAVSALAEEPAEHRLLLILTDGEPADIDVFDSLHLLHDARHAVAEASRRGIRVFCASLDPNAESYVARVYGRGRYLILDRLDRLPEKLARLLLALNRAYSEIS